MKTFIVIMGAGRCGSTSLISFLNKQPNFNIYGENNGIICSILKNISSLNHINIYRGLSYKQSNSNYKISQYIGSEWYNPKDKIDNLKITLINSILDYFNCVENYIGFKEIRWDNSSLQSLSILNKYYKMKYIHLIRNIEDQIRSINRVKWDVTDPKSLIETTNNSISNFLQKQHRKNYIVKNISVDINYKEDIYNFITA